jgi:nucleotide-binding universal stress UspA family protein
MMAQQNGGRMYKHILIPTDGSKLSERAVEAGIEFARFIHAKVTGFTAVPEYQVPSEAELMSKHGISLDDYERDAKKQAELALQPIADRARAAGIEYDAEFTQSDRPHEAIIRAAEKHGCDLIFMASHGRRGLSALVHGSETQAVLTHSSIPTLVYR